jgi:hypothetical protein
MAVDKTSAWKGFAAAVVAAITVALTLAAAPMAEASSPARQPARLDPSKLGQEPVVLRDAVVRDSSPVARTSAYGGIYTAKTGEQVRILMSDSYAPSDARLQTWADFIAGLPHGSELSRLTVYLAPLKEMKAICSEGADSCYDSADERMTLIGDTPPDGVPLEEIVAHEYGHHLARNRSNAPWSAVDWGPKNWASRENVCAKTKGGDMFPGGGLSMGDDYRLDPGEGFAEAYRVFAGGDAGFWQIVSNVFKPNSGDLKAISDDVYKPWTGQATTVYKGSFSRSGSKTRKVLVDGLLDGRADITLKGSSRLNGDLYIYGDDGKLLQRSATPSSKERVRLTICGQKNVVIRVVNAKGKGSYRLQVTKP